jgi:hypothetical protein
MSYITCPDCGRKIYLFGEGKSEEAAAAAQPLRAGENAHRPRSGRSGGRGKIEEFQGSWLDGAADALEAVKKQ